VNGKPNDNPITDMLFYGKHPFPGDMEAMIRKLHAIDRRLMNDLKWEPFAWEKGERLDEGRELLRELLQRHDGQNGTSKGSLPSLSNCDTGAMSLFENDSHSPAAVSRQPTRRRDNAKRAEERSGERTRLRCSGEGGSE
jgi:hypothetical protein